VRTFQVTREPRYEGYDSLHRSRQYAPGDFLILVDGEPIGGTYWAGAATAAQDDPQAVPLTVAEIKQIEQLRHQIQYFTGYYMHGSRDPMLDQADDLLNKLHFLAGHAKATSTLGGVTTLLTAEQAQARWTQPHRPQLPAGGNADPGRLRTRAPKQRYGMIHQTHQRKAASVDYLLQP
jgi:hypothetical protein